MNAIETAIERNPVRIGRRIIVDSNPNLAGIIQERTRWSAFNSYKISEFAGKKISLRYSEIKEFSEYVQKINEFLKGFLLSHFALSIQDWAKIDSGSVVLLDDKQNNCYGSFYFYDQVIALSRTAILERGNDKVFLSFVHTLLHELIHAQSAHVFVSSKKQSSQPVAFQDPTIARQGLYYTDKQSVALDEAITEILAIKATLEYFKNEDVSNQIDPSYQNYIQNLTDVLENASKNNNAQNELFAALVLHKFGAIDYKELLAEFAKHNATDTLEQLFFMR